MKRPTEFLAALLLTILLLPVWLPILVIQLLTGNRSVFYLSERVGLNGRRFTMYKFTTMYEGSPDILTREITVKDDPRILPFGKFIRKTKLDELPQLLNILKGDIGFVGPRPLPPRHFHYYTKEQQEVISRMKPGITGLASVYFRNEAVLFDHYDTPPEECYATVITPRKAALEMWYYKNRSVWLDLKILLCTAVVIFQKNSPLPEKLFKKAPGMLQPIDKPVNFNNPRAT
jgi:lipopolysaccharide/colanic/teichoic acid biosynthesis glycosyltransferase